MVFEPAFKIDMIDRALNENCRADTEHSDFDLNADQHEDMDILDNMSSGNSARNTVDNNNKVLEETKALMSQLKLSLNVADNDQGDGQTA